MTKKPAARKKTTKAKLTAKRRPAAKTSISVGGNIIARRDVIMGDQYNYDQRQIANIASPAEFVSELQKLQAQIGALRQQPTLSPAEAQTIEVVEGQIKDVVEEAQKPQPLAARMTATLTGAKAVMDSLAGSVNSAVGFGAALAGLGQIALKQYLSGLSLSGR